MKVYRIETTDGTGVYNIGGIFGNPLHMASSGTQHPAPWRDDCDMCHVPGWVCGFATLDQARDWFACDAEIVSALMAVEDMASDSGLALSVYEVESAHVKVGRRQCMFDRFSARLVETFPLDVLRVTPLTPERVARGRREVEARAHADAERDFLRDAWREVMTGTEDESLIASARTDIRLASIHPADLTLALAA